MVQNSFVADIHGVNKERVFYFTSGVSTGTLKDFTEKNGTPLLFHKISISPDFLIQLKKIYFLRYFLLQRFGFEYGI